MIASFGCQRDGTPGHVSLAISLGGLSLVLPRMRAMEDQSLQRCHWLAVLALQARVQYSALMQRLGVGVGVREG